jgi:hypothetical protein
METKNFYNEICVEILAINDEGTKNTHQKRCRR